MVLTIDSSDEILKCDHSMQITEQYFPVLLFSMLYGVFLTCTSVDKHKLRPFFRYFCQRNLSVGLLVSNFDQGLSYEL